jgi:uncharacterized membrane protein
VFGATKELGRAEETGEQPRAQVDTEAPTRYYSTPAPSSYPSVFVPPAHQAPTYQPPAAQSPPVAPPPQPLNQPETTNQPPTSRILPGMALPENVALILSYLPLPVVGAVPGLIELLLVPRVETRVRFHAAQGLALHLVAIGVSTLFSIASPIGDAVGFPLSLILRIASTIFTLTAFVYFIISMIRVWKGEPHNVAPLADFTRWLNEKVEPKK